MSYANLSVTSHTFQVVATDGASNVDATPAERTWTVVPPPDTTAPDTVIDSGPSGSVVDTSATFSFSATEPSTFQCRLDGAASTPCTSPMSYANLSVTSHTFQVVATDGASNVDATPAERTWTVVPPPDTTAPDTVIDSGPSGSVVDTSATFSFSATEPSTFQCRLDGAASTPCTSPVSYANLSVTSHTFQVVATDGASNVDATPAERTWTVVPPPPELIGNPGFELGTSGWQGEVSTNTLSRVAGGHSGGWAAQISNSQAGGTCGLDDKPSWVSVTQAGPYTASIWVRSDTPGLTLRLRVREFASGVQQGSTTSTVALTTSWQRVTVTYTPVAPGQSSLDFEAYTLNSPVGVCFQADDASITH